MAPAIGSSTSARRCRSSSTRSRWARMPGSVDWSASEDRPDEVVADLAAHAAPSSCRAIAVCCSRPSAHPEAELGVVLEQASWTTPVHARRRWCPTGSWAGCRRRWRSSRWRWRRSSGRRTAGSAASGTGSRRSRRRRRRTRTAARAAGSPSPCRGAWRRGPGAGSTGRSPRLARSTSRCSSTGSMLMALWPATCLLVGRAQVDADAAAGAVVGGDLDAQQVRRVQLAGLEVLGQEAVRGPVERVRLEHLHPDRGVRAHDRALAAVDADLRVPDRDLGRDRALLVLGRPGREGAVHRQRR